MLTDGREGCWEWKLTSRQYRATVGGFGRVWMHKPPTLVLMLIARLIAQVVRLRYFGESRPPRLCQVSFKYRHLDSLARRQRYAHAVKASHLHVNQAEI